MRKFSARSDQLWQTACFYINDFNLDPVGSQAGSARGTLQSLGRSGSSKAAREQTQIFTAEYARGAVKNSPQAIVPIRPQIEIRSFPPSFHPLIFLLRCLPM